MLRTVVHDARKLKRLNCAYLCDVMTLCLCALQFCWSFLVPVKERRIARVFVGVCVCVCASCVLCRVLFNLFGVIVAEADEC